MYGVVGRYNEPPLPLAAFSVLCLSISAANSSSLIWPRRAWLWDPMSFSYSLRRSINRLRRSFLASSSASLMRNLLYTGARDGRTPSLQVIMAHRHPSGTNPWEHFYHGLR